MVFWMFAEDRYWDTEADWRLGNGFTSRMMVSSERSGTAGAGDMLLVSAGRTGGLM